MTAGPALQSIAVEVPEDAVQAFEAALRMVCGSVGLFRDEETGQWRVEGILAAGTGEAALTAGLALAEAASGISPVVLRQPVAAEGWLRRSMAGFPEQRIGRRLAVRGSHLAPGGVAGRVTLVLDAGVAFGSGEHGSTRGCLLGLERILRRRPRRVLDLGTGSGVLALAAARLLRRPVLAVDIEPWSVRSAADNARRNGVGPRIRCVLANGWRSRTVRAGRPFDLVFANILARPLCAMARDLSAGLAPGGTAILGGLLASQARQVLAAHRRRGLRLEAMIGVGGWATLVLRRAYAKGRA